MRIGVYATSLALLAAPLVARAEPVTEANRTGHPSIVEVRAIHREIQRAEAAGRLRKERRTFASCRPYQDADRVLQRDERGTVRRYRRGAGSDDSAIQATYDYDRHGRLRFVLATAGAVNGTALEYRIYLSETGKRLWEERRALKGPGYSFPLQLPDDWLVRDPVQAFQAQPPCTDERN